MVAGIDDRDVQRRLPGARPATGDGRAQLAVIESREAQRPPLVCAVLPHDETRDRAADYDERNDGQHPPGQPAARPIVIGR